MPEYQWPDDFWKHQTRACESATATIASGKRRIILTAPCGTGKSKIMAALTEWATQQWWNSIIYSHRRMLLTQTSNVLSNHNIEHGFRASGHKPALLRSVQLAMVQTELSAVLRKKSRPIHNARLVLSDEIHAMGGGTLAELHKQHYDAGSAIIGVTATPIDLPGEWDELIVACTTSEGRKCGALVPAYTYCPDEPDLKHVKNYRVGEDLTDAQNKKVMMRPGVFGRVMTNWKRLNPTAKPTILFAPDVAGSLYFAEQFHKQGFRAAHIDAKQIWYNGEYMDSDDENREWLLKAFTEGEVQVITNRFVLREGIDLPCVAHAIFACVVGSLKSWLQMAGRAIRAHPSTPSVILQDHGGSYCLDSATEVLSQRGWLGPDQVLPDDMVAGYDRMDGSISWQKIDQIIDRKLNDGEAMYSASGRACDIRVTGNHRMVYKKRTSVGKNYFWRDEFAIDRADALAQSLVRFKIPISGVQESDGVPLTDDEISFLGWFITDGCRVKSKKRSDAVTLCQSDHQPQIHHLRNCLTKCGFDFTESHCANENPSFPNGKPFTIFHIPRGTCKSRPRNGWWRLNEYVDKDFSPLLDAMTVRQLEIFLYSAYLGNGFKKAGRKLTSYKICTGNHLFAERLQSLCVRRGFKFNLSTRMPTGKTIQKMPLYIFNIQKSSHLILHGLHAAPGQTRLKQCETTLGERVWCVANALGTLVTRRNGKVAIVGNCRHGSVNEDRHWELGMSGYKETGLRQEKMRDNPELEPIRCPKCGAMRLSGPACLVCGFACHKRSRMVVQINGDLKLAEGPAFKKHYTKLTPDTERKWIAMVHRASSEKWNATPRQAEALFVHEEGYWPPHDLPLMPVEPSDFFERFRDIPKDRLR